MKKIELPRKPTYKKINLTLGFFELFKKIDAKYSACFLLESLGEESYNSRYSILGFDPENTISARGKTLSIDNQSMEHPNPYYALREIIPTNILSKNYAGGLVGYLSYEAMNYFEPSLQLPSHSLFNDYVFGLYLDGLVHDKMTGEIFYFYYTKDRSNLILEIAEDQTPVSNNFSAKFLGYTMTEEEHRKSVGLTIEEIKSGNTFQCQIGFKSEYKIVGDSILFYEELRHINPSPHTFYFKSGELKIIGASPELLFKLHNGEMETYPLAGSIRRGNTSIEDLAYAKHLLNDPKEIAEHNMLVDLHRNDIGRVAKFGTVKVRRLMDIKKFSHIQHISSEVSGIINHDEDMFSALSMNFPAGTLSGAPKIESMKIIRRIENLPRGPYGGAIGHFGFNGNCTFAIPIRSLFVQGSYAFTQASGGIVYDSKPENEYDEILRKSAAIKKALEKFLKVNL
jgi:anthranilate synthase component I